MKSNYKRLGDYIQPVNIRNKNIVTEDLRGLSMSKEFRKSTSNIVGTDLSKYKLVFQNQFACDFMSVIRVHKLPVVLHNEKDPVIVSPAYTVFEIIDTEVLNPEYLMMWFRRPEFDRYADFRCDSAIRGGFKWDELCEVELPIPSIEKQNAIVKEYNTVVNRIKLNEQLNQKLEETAQAIYKHWFVDFEFPNKDGKPYKSSGGKMVWNEVLGKEIPEGWEILPLKSLGLIKGGKRLPSGESLRKQKNNHPYIKVADLSKGKFSLLNENFEYVSDEVQNKISRYTVTKGDLIVSIVGTIGIIKLIHKSLDKANLTENCVKITNLKDINSTYLYHYFKTEYATNEIKMRNVGAVQAKLPIYNIESFPVLSPNKRIFGIFNIVLNKLDERIINTQIENIKLLNIKDLLLSKMSKLKTEKEII